MTPAVNGSKDSKEHGTLLPALIGKSAEELENGKMRRLIIKYIM